MKTIDEICDEHGFKYLDGNINAIKTIQADALRHAAAKIRNQGSSSSQWMATDLESEAEQLKALK
jgi:hypothetical protein